MTGFFPFKIATKYTKNLEDLSLQLNLLVSSISPRVEARRHKAVS